MNFCAISVKASYVIMKKTEESTFFSTFYRSFISMMCSSPALSKNLFQYSVTECRNKLCPCGDDNSTFGEECDQELSEESGCRFEESAYCSEELEYVPSKKLSLWETILQESAERLAPLYEWQEENRASEFETESDRDDSPVKYLNDKIFPILLPIMEQMLIEASRWNVLENHKCLFNGLDYVARHLWNGNPQHPERSAISLQLFDIPPFKLWLKEHPRPVYPKSWLWTRDEAAGYIQRYVRGWIVRKRDDVQELRQFWKALAAEKFEKENISVQSSDDSITAIVPKREELQELNVCDRYRLLTKLCTTR